MCGIAGIVFAEKQKSANPLPESEIVEIVATMTSELEHRGPDQWGFHRSTGVALGHRRLSVIDLKDGQQPIYSESRKQVLVYNGEVYNYQEIRRALSDRHSFLTNTDSEVLIHLYEDFGTKFSCKLNGMYAFAIWDEIKNSLILGIDRFGIKPLYYFEKDGLLAFCSELKPLVRALNNLGETIEPNYHCFSEYLKLGWFPAPSTAVSGIRKLLPGEVLEYRNSRLKQVDRLPLPEPLNIEGKDKTKALTEHLEQAIERQLVADVPAGILLSGGVDSSLLAALASRNHKGIETFNIGFSSESRESKLADESLYASAVAKHLGCKHHSWKMTAKSLLENLDDCLSKLDEPIADPAVLPLLQICNLARKHVTVALSGDGADELFAGYLRHVMLLKKLKLQKLPAPLLKTFNYLSKSLPEKRYNDTRDQLRKIRLACELMTDLNYRTGPFGGKHSAWLGESPTLSPELLPSIFADQLEILEYDLRVELAGQMLPKTDRISMSTSLEVRVPFLDNKIVSLARNFQLSEKVQGGMNKAPLRQVLSTLLPDSIAKRPKHGFRVPLSEWLRTDLEEYSRSLLLDSSYIPEVIVSRKSVEQMLYQHNKQRIEHSNRIWALIALAHWLRSLSQITSTTDREMLQNNPQEIAQGKSA
ncbi:asparagine synthase (glutamine-hydrolyzing) [bacterium J17]|nr:asparagine synthase (glutamine-hydrolyzing) [bacterium J17]